MVRSEQIPHPRDGRPDAFRNWCTKLFSPAWGLANLSGQVSAWCPWGHAQARSGVRGREGAVPLKQPQKQSSTHTAEQEGTLASDPFSGWVEERHPSSSTVSSQTSIPAHVLEAPGSHLLASLVPEPVRCGGQEGTVKALWFQGGAS